METRTQSILERIAGRAQRESGCRFTTLAHLLDEEYLKWCYNRLERNRAGGIDGISWQEYGKQLDGNIKRLVERMKAKQYKPQPARRVYIPKDEHSKRPLGLPAVEDKTVQKGLAGVLGAIYEQDFLDSSYGFRPGRDCHQALKAVNTAFTLEPINHVIEADIKGYFDNVSHERLIEVMGRRINDPSFLLLIRRFLKAGYVEDGERYVSEEGTPQGGNLSPILANIYLHYVLDEWLEKEIKPRMRGVVRLVRYADDFICMVQYADEAAEIMEEMKARFSEYGLELNATKSRVISFGRYEEENARRQNRKANTFDFLGFTHYCGRSRKGLFLLGRRTSGRKFRKKCAELNAWLKAVRNASPVQEWWPVLKAKVTGHYQYYGVSGNYAMIRNYHRQALKLAIRWLNRRSQKKRFNMESYGNYLKLHPLPIPRLAHNFYTLKFAT
jgi:group II intron reverse transcriptase/maturase